MSARTLVVAARRRRPLAVLLAALIGTGCATRTTSRPDVVPPASDWSAVRALAVGSDVRAITSMADVSGTVVAALADELILAQRDSRRVLPRASIQRVLVTRREVSRRVVYGAIGGAVGGAVLGAATTKGDSGAFVALLSAGWAAVGGIVGLISGGFVDHATTIYAAPGTGTPFAARRTTAARGWP